MAHVDDERLELDVSNDIEALEERIEEKSRHLSTQDGILGRGTPETYMAVVHGRDVSATEAFQLAEKNANIIYDSVKYVDNEVELDIAIEGLDKYPDKIQETVDLFEEHGLKSVVELQTVVRDTTVRHTVNGLQEAGIPVTININRDPCQYDVKYIVEAQYFPSSGGYETSLSARNAEDEPQVQIKVDNILESEGLLRE